MADQNLIRYVIVARSRGFSDDAIKQRLRQSGWSERDIEGAFYLSTNPQALAGPSSSSNPGAAASLPSRNPLKNVSPFLLGALVILAVLLIASIAFTFTLLSGGGSENESKATGAIANPSSALFVHPMWGGNNANAFYYKSAAYSKLP